MACLTVEFVSSRNCFVVLPKLFITNELSTATVLRVHSITDGQPSVRYLSWNGRVSPNNNLQIDGNFGSINGLADGQTVVLEVVKPGTVSFRDCTYCVIEPLTGDDYELLVTHSVEIESGLLQNIKCVNTNLIIPIWPNSSNINLKVRITSVHPNNDDDPVILTGTTEMHLSDPDSRSNSQEPSDVRRLHSPRYHRENSQSQDGLFSSVFSMVKSYLHQPQTIPSTSQISATQNMESPVNNSNSIKIEKLKLTQGPLRVVECFDFELEKSLYCSIIVNPEDVVDHSGSETVAGAVVIAKMIKIIPPSAVRAKTTSRLTTDVSVSKDEIAQNTEDNIDKNPPPFTESNFRSSIVLIRMDSSVKRGYCQVPQTIRRRMGLFVASKVILKNIKLNHVMPAWSLNVIPVGPSNQFAPVKEKLKSKLYTFCSSTMKDQHLVLSKSTMITIDDVDILIDSSTSDESIPSAILSFLHPSDIESIDINIRDPMIKRFQTNYGLQLPAKTTRDLDNRLGFNRICPSITDKPVSECSKRVEDLEALLNNYLDTSDRRKKIYEGSILISGQKGCGKTHLTHQLAEKLRHDHKRIFVSFADLRSWRGKRIEAIKKLMTRIFTDANYYQPSVIVFENIESILHVENFKQEGETTVDLLYYQRLLSLFIDFLGLIERAGESSIFGGHVALIATCSSKEDLVGPLIEAKGRHYFTKHIELKDPDLDAICDILKDMLSDRKFAKFDYSDEDIKYIARKCDAFRPIDLKTIADRCINRACGRSFGFDSTPGVIKLCLDDFKDSIENYKPLAMRGVELHKKSDICFDHIGGLKDTKETIRSTILWPIKYATLFSRSPIRHQSSILLYGPPGCGKTMIAEAVANEIPMNLICVRGPELLSKYIGASEEAVRDLFRRAESAKPCVVFFDEFESLAPRRGHDSTGVTDRIVNQLLTQLDGVEQISRDIYIIAATSRPDLLDPALLRPGRFDKHIYCALPSATERLEILQIMTRQLDLAEDVNLEHCADLTNNFSGADLQALCYTAQLNALHTLIDGKPTCDKSKLKIVINSSDLSNAFESTKQSVRVDISKYPREIPRVPVVVSARATLA